MIAGLIAAGLAIDLGRLYFTQRDLQRLANMAALDAARVAGGCMGEVSNQGAAALAEAQASVQRNGGDRDWVRNGAADIVGELDISGGLRRFVGTSSPPRLDRRAVQVHMGRAAPTRLIPLLSSNTSATLNAFSAVHSSPRATLLVGSKLAAIENSDVSPLNALYSGLFGTPFTLGLVTYQGLFTSTLPVQDLLDELGLGDADESLDQDVPVASLLDAIATLSGPAGADVGDVAADGDVVLGEVLGVDRPVSGSVINAGDLLTAIGEERASELGEFGVELPLSVPGVGDTLLQLISPGLPVPLAPGGRAVDLSNIANNTQLRLESVLQLPPILGLVTTGNPVVLFVEGATAEAEVDSIHCARRGDGDTEVDSVDVSAESFVGRIGISPVKIVDTNLLGVGRVEITLSADIAIPAANSQYDPPSTWQDLHVGDVRTLQINAVDLEAGLSLEVCVTALLGGRVCGPNAENLLPGVVDAVADAVLAPLNTILLPLLQPLGVNIAGADVSVIAIDAREPLLFTH